MSQFKVLETRHARGSGHPKVCNSWILSLSGNDNTKIAVSCIKLRHDRGSPSLESLAPLL